MACPRFNDSRTQPDRYPYTKYELDQNWSFEMGISSSLPVRLFEIGLLLKSVSVISIMIHCAIEKNSWEQTPFDQNQISQFYSFILLLLLLFLIRRLIGPSPNISNISGNNSRRTQILGYHWALSSDVARTASICSSSQFYLEIYALTHLWSLRVEVRSDGVKMVPFPVATAAPWRRWQRTVLMGLWLGSSAHFM